MHRQKRIFIVCFFLLAGRLWAQNPERTLRMGLSGGLSSYYVKDEIISPLIYKDVNFPLRLTFEKEKKKNIHTVLLNYDSPLLKNNNVNNSQTRSQIIHFQYNYGRFFKKFRQYQFYLGGSAQVFVNIKNHSFDRSYNSDYQTADLFSSVNAYFSVQRQFGEKNRIQSTLTYPLFAYVIGRVYSLNQPPPSLLDEENISNGDVLTSGEWLTVNRFVDFQWTVSYTYQLHRRWNWVLQYWFRYYRYPKLPIVQNGSHQLLLGLEYKF